MAIHPIDLQTLFTQSNQVGKEQAAQKDAPPIAQSLQGAQLVQKTEVRDTSVNETHEQEEGPEKVRDKARRGTERRGKRKEPKQAPAAPAHAPTVVKDPDLGRNVDITS